MTVLRSQFDLVLEVAGERYDVVQFEADFSMNQIPHGVCLLSVGRESQTGIPFAKIHYNLQEFARSENTAKVFFCPSGEWSETNPWPAGEHLIFEGRVVGIGLKKEEKLMRLVVQLQHWLGDLNFSSCMSEQSHPTNISEYTFAATVGPGLFSQAGDLKAMSSTGEAVTLTSQVAIETDLWGEAIKPFFCKLAEAANMQFSSDLIPCGNIKQQDNTQALAALRRIEGESTWSQSSCSLAPSCYTPKLTMIADGQQRIPAAVRDSIADYMSQQMVSSFEHQTIWGKLVGEFGPAFRFCVVPLVERALVVPVVAGLRHTWCKKIFACDYNSLNYSAEVIRPIRAVALMAGVKTRSGFGNSGSTQGVSKIIGCGGCWGPDLGEDRPGMILVQRLDPWLDEMAVSSVSSGNTIGIGGKFRSSTLAPKKEPDPDAKGLPDGASVEDTILTTSAVCNGLAHAKYVAEVLRGRSATISGKLRFDIAPGSTVWVEGTSERFMESQVDTLGQNLVGLVMRVSFGLNAESAAAGTALTLSCVRTEKENQDDSTSVDCHPLYADRFLGAPLVDALWFRDEGEDCCSAGTTDPNLVCS